MDNRSKILVSLFFLAIFISGALVFVRYMILKDYEVVTGEAATGDLGE